MSIDMYIELVEQIWTHDEVGCCYKITYFNTLTQCIIKQETCYENRPWEHIKEQFDCTYNKEII